MVHLQEETKGIICVTNILIWIWLAIVHGLAAIGALALGTNIVMWLALRP